MLDEKTIMSPRHSTGFRGINKIGVEDFKLLNQTGTYDRRDKVCDGKMHDEMLDAMVSAFSFRLRIMCHQPLMHDAATMPFNLAHNRLRARDNQLINAPCRRNPPLRQYDFHLNRT
jgi:hypothetical protein